MNSSHWPSRSLGAINQWPARKDQRARYLWPARARARAPAPKSKSKPAPAPWPALERADDCRVAIFEGLKFTGLAGRAARVDN